MIVVTQSRLTRRTRVRPLPLRRLSTMSAPILLYSPRDVLPESESEMIPGPADEDEPLPKRMKRMTPTPMQVMLKKNLKNLKKKTVLTTVLHTMTPRTGDEADDDPIPHTTSKLTVPRTNPAHPLYNERTRHRCLALTPHASRRRVPLRPDLQSPCLARPG
ncbi:hypothetical protein FKP32DRAFT_1406982, partial [Trametes sanguinea]